jgi:hypothetical protein
MKHPITISSKGKVNKTNKEVIIKVDGVAIGAIDMAPGNSQTTYVKVDPQGKIEYLDYNLKSFDLETWISIKKIF